MASKNRADEGVEQETAGELDGFTFVFDGLEQRWEEHAQRHGGSVAENVSSGIDYLVTGDDPDQANLDDACAYDVPTLGEYEFEELVRAKQADS